MPYKNPNDPRKHKSLTIADWKRKGLICREGETYDDIYFKVMNTTNCENCNIQFDNILLANRRCMDHDHKTRWFRKVLCNKCNATYGVDLQNQKTRINNTTGHKNISKLRNVYLYKKTINGKTFHKTFKTLEEAIEFKISIINKNNIYL